LQVTGSFLVKYCFCDIKVCNCLENNWQKVEAENNEKDENTLIGINPCVDARRNFLVG